MDPCRYYVCPLLELFHPFEHLCELIWRQPVFFRCFLAPFVHSFFSSKVYIKPTLKSIESFLMVLRMGYGRHRDRLLALLPTLDRRSDVYNHARNFFALNDFFIPLVQHYGCVIRSGDYVEFQRIFPVIHICFAIFNNTEYLHAIGMQRLLWKFQESINHPFLAIIRESFPNLVAEDIELANRALAHAVRSKRGQGDFNHLDTAYRWLGSMLRHKETQRLNILQSRSLKGWETKKRLTYRLLSIAYFTLTFFLDMENLVFKDLQTGLNQS